MLIRKLNAAFLKSNARLLVLEQRYGDDRSMEQWQEHMQMYDTIKKLVDKEAPAFEEDPYAGSLSKDIHHP